ncbi:MAG: hypothetical protein R3F50_21040 [Gammaproteobacteria bacterium]
MQDKSQSVDRDTQADSGATGEKPAASEHGPETGIKAPAHIWPQFRRLLVFQVKLYIDALRDLLLSPLSVVVFCIDVVQGNHGEKALFASLLKFGRKTEQAINLFDQHDADAENSRGIDRVILQFEEAVRKEYTNGSVSANARDSIEKSLQGLRAKIKGAREPE